VKFSQASLDGIDCLAAIGPTGKPAQKLQHWRAVVFLYLKFSQASLENFRYKKSFSILRSFCGLDGTRTRDPLRDRQIF
jgi:hypothetical protein